MSFIFRAAVLTVTIVVFLKAGQVHGDSDSPRVCAGYPVLSETKLGSVPGDTPFNRVDVNSDGAVDLIAANPEGGSALYVNCGGGLYYCAVQSAARLQARPAKEGEWASLFIAWEEERSTLIDGRLYWPDLLPFTSKAPADFLIEHNGTTYALPFGYCNALGLWAPRYRFDRKPQGKKKNTEQVSTLYLELAQTKFRINEDAQEEYALGEVYFTDLNADGALDAVLLYEERYGSGREAWGGLLLNCGDDSFVVSGRVRFGRVGGMTFTLLQSQKMSICGVPFTTVVVKRPRDANVSVPLQRHQIDYDLYLYRPFLKNFFQITSVPDPYKSTFDLEIKGQCEYILKHAYILMQ